MRATLQSKRPTIPKVKGIASLGPRGRFTVHTLHTAAAQRNHEAQDATGNFPARCCGSTKPGTWNSLGRPSPLLVFCLTTPHPPPSTPLPLPLSVGLLVGLGLINLGEYRLDRTPLELDRTGPDRERRTSNIRSRNKIDHAVPRHAICYIPLLVRYTIERMNRKKARRLY